jgi:hypothetical protein
MTWNYLSKLMDSLRERDIEPNDCMKGRTFADGSTLLDLGKFQVHLHPDVHNTTMNNPANIAEVHNRIEYPMDPTTGNMVGVPVLHLTRAFSPGINDETDLPIGSGLGATIGDHENSHIADIIQGGISNPPPDHSGRFAIDYSNEIGQNWQRGLEDCSTVMTDRRLPGPGHTEMEFTDPGWQSMHDLCVSSMNPSMGPFGR